MAQTAEVDAADPGCLCVFCRGRLEGKTHIIRYEVFGKPQSAGPYTPEEVEAHAKDIGGYEGISNVTIRNLAPA